MGSGQRTNKEQVKAVSLALIVTHAFLSNWPAELTGRHAHQLRLPIILGSPFECPDWLKDGEKHVAWQERGGSIACCVGVDTK